MLYRETALPEALRHVALCAWQFVVEPGDPPAFDHQVPPDGAPGLVLTRAPDGALHPRIVGPSLVGLTVPLVRGCDYAGLRLRPEMARSLLGEVLAPGSMRAATPTGALAPIWDDLAAMTDGIEAWSGTLGQWHAIGRGDEAIAGGIDRLIASGGTLPIAGLAALSGLSERQFRRRFHAATGIAPKQFADVQRVRRALILSLGDGDWAGVAQESGFADQPHLIRDMRERFGRSPQRIAGYFHGIRHELLAPTDDRNLQAVRAEAA